jgi:tRNA-specific 2-thiouridylase
MKKKVALGLSGGVDSSVCAQLLLNKGYEVTGVYLECYREPGCRTDEDRQDALTIAQQLSIPFLSLDYRLEYRQNIINYIYKSYQSGMTPNPDLICNREVKFGLFYSWALAHGFDFIATGHYARLKNNQLYTALDPKKDQTYFLALVPHLKWERVLFPIGHYQKTQVRALARQWHLPVADKKDSTGICFIGKVGMRDFLRHKIPSRPGPIIRFVDKQKKIIGQHDGLSYYTLGQRHGFALKQIDPQTPALYVLAKNEAENELIVGEKSALNKKTLILKQSQGIDIFTQKPHQLYIRIRHQGELTAVSSFTKLSNHCLQVSLKKSVFAPSPGQFAVFYRRDVSHPNHYFCLGAGIIT